MRLEGRPFVPERLRPRPARRRPRHLAMLALVPVLFLPLGWWRIDRVEVRSCPAVPREVEVRLAGIVGASPLTLDLRSVQHLVEAWPGVAGVSVAFELPSTLRVEARPSKIVGSMPVGAAWHGIALGGEPAARIHAPVSPVLLGFRASADELGLGLAVAERLEQGSSLPVREVRQVMPGDLEAVLGRTDQPPIVVRVAAQATPTERDWCAAVAAGAPPAVWTDLRQPHRVIVRRAP